MVVISKVQPVEIPTECQPISAQDAINLSRHEFTWQGETFGAKCYVGYARAIPDHPFKLRLARYIARQFFRSGLPVSGPDGSRLRLNPEDYIAHAIIVTGSYESKSLALARWIMAAEGGTFLDVGSNFGLYTCTVGVMSGVRCVAIEPAAEAFLQLKYNASFNQNLNVTLVNLGLASTPGVQRIELPVESNLGTMRIALNEDQTTALSKYYIGCFTLNELLDQIQDVGPIRLLKIDVEGYEMEVFKGLEFTGLYRPSNVIAEFSNYMNRASCTTEQALRFFRDHDYDAFTVEGKPIGRVCNLPENNIWFKSR